MATMIELEQKYRALLDEAERRGLPDVDNIRLCFRALSLAAAIDRDCAAMLAPHGLSEGRFVLLFLLDAAGAGIAPKVLAEQAGVTRATVTGLLDGWSARPRSSGGPMPRTVAACRSGSRAGQATGRDCVRAAWRLDRRPVRRPVRAGAAPALGAARQGGSGHGRPYGGAGRMNAANAAATRKGASRAADIAPTCLPPCRAASCRARRWRSAAVDRARLLGAVFPALPPLLHEAAGMACRQGILQRMRCIADLLWAELGGAGIDACARHGSDTVRGWSCFMIGAQPGLDTDARTDAIRQLADDPHFGVREWAGWHCGLTAAALPAAIERLAGWTSLPSERLRRFACEALRPRGVWCAHRHR